MIVEKFSLLVIFSCYCGRPQIGDKMPLKRVVLMMCHVSIIGDLISLF